MKSLALLSFALSSLVLLQGSCSSDDDSNADGVDGSVADGGTSADPDAMPALSCNVPTRMVVLGDSIAACFGVGDKNAATCGLKILHEYTESNYAPGLVYENRAVSGAVTTDVPDKQLATVTTGTGHVVVVIYVGGNDLQKYLTSSDSGATTGYETDLPGILADWDSIFSFFDDTANFPDGATVIMNNQYSPFDDCTASPYNISAVKTAILNDYNTELEQVADAHDNAFLTDQHTPYLGHGHHYQVQSCPHYQAGLTPFMEDLIHPNVAGHAHLAAQWTSVADTVYASCQ